MNARIQPVYLVDGCRSPIGRSHPEKGILASIRADDLSVQVLNDLLRRTGVDPAQIDDLYLGCVGQHLEQGKNLARLIVLLSDLPKTIPGVTINRLCASSLTALGSAADSIRAGSNNIVLVGGVEHLGHVPMTAALNYNPRLFEGYPFQWTNMGLTAEKLASDFNITREKQDEFTYQSNDRYFRAINNGFYNDEIIGITLPDGQVVSDDQEPRLSDISKLSMLKPVFKEDGTVTAANSSGISDGACMSLVCDSSALTRYGWDPLAQIVSHVTVGLSPDEMGLGPVPAIRKLLKKTGLSVQDIDLYEINEAFAVQVLACQEQLGIGSEVLNIHGGAVAMGHPLGMTGIRLALTLSRSMKEKNARYGIAALCVGHGQGMVMLLRRDQ